MMLGSSGPVGSLATPPQVIIFDFDGVILDSAGLKLQAYATLYAGEDPAKVRDLLAHAQLHGGITRRTKLAYYEREMFGRAGDQGTVDLLAAKYAEIVYQAVLECPFIPGAQRVLEHAHKSIAMHVVSGTPENELKEVISKRGLTRYFRSAQGAPTTKPAAFADIVAKERCEKTHVLAIGDSVTEYLAAQEVGIPFLGIIPPHETNPFPQDVCTLPDLEGLAPLLKFK